MGNGLSPRPLGPSSYGRQWASALRFGWPPLEMNMSIAMERAGRRLRLVMQRPAPIVQITSDRPHGPTAPEIEFIAYADDCILMGHVRVDADRLSDLMNEHEEFQLVDVEVHALAVDRALEIKDVLLHREEIILVHAFGPRGDRGRRLRTRQHSMAIRAGPYAVHGYLHALPGTDPVNSFRHRKPIVPLTEASIEFEQGSIVQRRTVSTLLVNRHQVDWIAEAVDEEIEYPEIAREGSTGPLLKDFTGQLRG